MDALTEKPGSRNLLDHFSTVTDPRHPWRVAHPLPEVLLLVVCATIASNDDYDDMVDWGETHLSFLRRFSEFHFGIPCADWLRTLMNRIDPDLFSACFMAWVRDWWPETPDLIALDGKAVTAQSRPQSGPKGTPFRLGLRDPRAPGARIGILRAEVERDHRHPGAARAPCCLRQLQGRAGHDRRHRLQPGHCEAIVEGGADYLKAVKENQPTLHGEVAGFFATARPDETETVVEVDKDHGRIETRRCVVSRQVDSCRRSVRRCAARPRTRRWPDRAPGSRSRACPRRRSRRGPWPRAAWRG